MQRLGSPMVTGAFLLFAALLGLAVASSPLNEVYERLLAYVPFPRSPFPLDTEKWVSEGLMSVFFATLALEIKYDLTEGALSSWKSAALPLVGAAGGMAVPALVAAFCGATVPGSPGLQGWAIPTATDAAFTVPIMAALPHVPGNLRAFLMALAIFDDLGAILILALFYGHSPALPPLALALVPTGLMAFLGWKKITNALAYLPFAFLLWVVLLKAGLEPTLAGVVFGICYPANAGTALNHKLSLPVGLAVLPLFAFVSTGVDMRLFTPLFLLSGPFLGSALGLAAGKPVGVFGSVWLVNKTGLLPALPGVRGVWLLGMGMVCGVGFTMSLLIAGLAYPDAIPLMQARCGVLAGSLLSAVLGWSVLRAACAKSARTQAAQALSASGSKEALR